MSFIAFREVGFRYGEKEDAGNSILRGLMKEK